MVPEPPARPRGLLYQGFGFILVPSRFSNPEDPESKVNLSRDAIALPVLAILSLPGFSNQASWAEGFAVAQDTASLED